MADISMCGGEMKVGDKTVICPKRDNCYRYTADADEHWQCWIGMEYDFVKEYCENFWDNKSWIRE